MSSPQGVINPPYASRPPTWPPKASNLNPSDLQHHLFQEFVVFGDNHKNRFASPARPPRSPGNLPSRLQEASEWASRAPNWLPRPAQIASKSFVLASMIHPRAAQEPLECLQEPSRCLPGPPRDVRKPPRASQPSKSLQEPQEAMQERPRASKMPPSPLFN